MKTMLNTLTILLTNGILPVMGLILVVTGIGYVAMVLLDTPTRLAYMQLLEIERISLPCVCGRTHKRWRVHGWRWDRCRHIRAAR